MDASLCIARDNIERWRRNRTYRDCIEEPTARGAADCLKTIREAIDVLLAATIEMLAIESIVSSAIESIGERGRTPAQRLLGSSLYQHLECVLLILVDADNTECWQEALGCCRRLTESFGTLSSAMNRRH